MKLTNDASDTIRKRAIRDAAFREGLLLDGIDCILAGEINVGEALINDYIFAQIQSEEQSRSSKKSKSIKRIIKSKDNPADAVLFAVIKHLWEQGGFSPELKFSKAA